MPPVAADRFIGKKMAIETKGKVAELKLPDEARVICIYRDEQFLLADQETSLHVDDEAIVLTHSKHLAELTKRFHKKNAGNGEDDGQGG